MYESAREDVEARSFDSYKRGRDLDAKLSRLCLGSAAEPTAAELAQVKKLVEEYDIQAISVALLTDIGSDAKRSWSASRLWHDVKWTEWDRRRAEIVPFARQRIREILSAAKVESAIIDRYLAHLPERAVMSFVSPPFERPTQAYELTGEDLTTDFILNSRLYDVGQMGLQYIMSWERAATMQPDRLLQVIPRLWSYDDDQVRWMVARAIVELPGDNFLNLLVERCATGDDISVNALGTIHDRTRIPSRILGLLDCAHGEAEERLWVAITDYGTKAESQPYRPSAEFFTKAIVERARERLKQLEADASDEAGRTASAVHAYLEAAGR